MINDLQHGCFNVKRKINVKHRNLEWTILRLRLIPSRALLHSIGLAIVMASMLLIAGALLPLSASAQTVPLKTMLFTHHSVLADSTVSGRPRVPPNVVNRLRQALSKQTTIPAAKLKFVEATPKSWTDGCFGLARSGEMCTQSIVKGWRVVFTSTSSGQRWIYRTDQQGRSYRLEP